MRRIWPGGGSWPEEPRSAKELEMHVGEVTAREIRRLLHTAGFRNISVGHTPWVYVDHVPRRSARAVFKLLAAFPPTRALGRASILASAER